MASILLMGMLLPSIIAMMCPEPVRTRSGGLDAMADSALNVSEVVWVSRDDCSEVAALDTLFT